MTDTRADEIGLYDLIRDVDAAANAYLRGDLTAYADLIHHGDDYTLMPPFGGETRRGFTLTPERVASTREMFQGGEATVDVEATYQSRDLVVLVAVERQHGVVADLPDQDWSLRVTLVFRRAEVADGRSEWQLVHRHADPLVPEIPMPQLTELVRASTV